MNSAPMVRGRSRSPWFSILGREIKTQFSVTTRVCLIGSVLGTLPGGQGLAVTAVAAACLALFRNGAGDGNRTHKRIPTNRYLGSNQWGKCDSSARFRGAWARSGNPWQLTGTAQNDLSPPIDRDYPLLQTQGVIQLRELPIERPQWQMPDLSCDLQREAV